MAKKVPVSRPRIWCFAMMMVPMPSAPIKPIMVRIMTMPKSIPF